MRERRKSAGDVVLDAVAPPPFDHSGSHKAAPPPVAARQRRGGGALPGLPGRGARSAPAALQSQGGGALPGRWARSAPCSPLTPHTPAALLSEEDASSAPAEQHRAAEQVADKKVVSKMEVPSPKLMMEEPAILGEGSLDKPSGISDLLTVLKSAILAH